jgi:hypothetical protein
MWIICSSPDRELAYGISAVDNYPTFVVTLEKEPVIRMAGIFSSLLSESVSSGWEIVIKFVTK